ncbi:ZIP family metal transporter [Paenibacillus doosanensis]|uniref:Zinc transporter ZupT n=1 Tax=Paenibacillus konkukensis TaxID=2020716 RepID=A0ABY4RPI3_9BACL|nr:MULTISPECIES: ZIP family metal transporter [Paenibacillus]MCS7459044.1 ZIP family metal transporter [Paenibacillus doosanensis]UQZ84098.1 Zinc transporter ZupT [Paenibacillus konkukensis]
MDEMALSGTIASLCTVLGAIPALLLQHVSHRGRDSLLAYTAGIMVAASTYSLIPSALKLSNMLVLTVGILGGTLALTLMEKWIPHTEPKHSFKREAVNGKSLFFLIAMGLHNLPEGLSVGVSFASEHQDLGPLVSFAIGLQNVPEGFLIALFLISQQVGKLRTMVYSAGTSLIELGACFAGYHFTSRIHNIVPYGLAFAAGAMLFVVYKELIPESHGDGHERPATFAFIVGLLTMIGLTHWLR